MKSILVILFFVVISFFLICSEHLGIGEKIGISCGGLCNISESVESLGVSCSTRNGSTPEEKITNNFNTYQMLTQKGDIKAIKYITPESIAYFDELIEKIKYHNQGQIKQDSYVRQMLILKIRKGINGNDLEHITGEELLTKLIKDKNIEELTFKGELISGIKVLENSSELTLRVDGITVSSELKFKKTEEKWKLDMVSLLAIQNDLIKQKAAKANLAPSEYIFNEVKKEYKEMNESVYTPLYIK